MFGLGIVELLIALVAGSAIFGLLYWKIFSKMKRTKSKIVLFIFLWLVIIVAFLRILSPEDSWIKDKNGKWIKHGNPSGPPPGEQTLKFH
jgi:hypothetical protein